MIVAYRNGAPVHLEEIGRITDDVQNNKTASWYNGERVDRARDSAAAGHEHGRRREPRQGGARPSSRPEIPPAVQVDTLYDRSATIKASVDDVTFTLELHARASSCS